MGYAIEWSAEALQSYTQILAYIQEQWTSKELDAFFDRTDQVLSYIADNPNLYQVSHSQGIYRAIINPQTSLYHEVFQDKFILLSFSDNRQDPQRLL